jgi:integrase
MSLVMRKNSNWWYGRYWVDGREFVKNLQVEIRGTRPEKLKETGSVHFENSRGEAQAALDKLTGEIQSGKSETQLAEAVYEARAGKKLKRYRIRDLAQIWLDKPSRRPLSEEHRKQTVAKLESFAGYLETHFPKLTRIDQLNPIHVQAFLNHLEQKGMTAETWNKYLIPIKTVLKRAGVPAAKEVLAKDTETVYRKPYTMEELNAILLAAQSDPLMYSLVVTAACTAMRRKDCCFLRWDAVDLAAGFITVKTSKTGQVVDIPMAKMLRTEIENQRGNGSDYVFPDAKLLYEADSTALTRRFKAVLRLAGFDDGHQPSTERKTDPCTDEEIYQAAVRNYTGEKLTRVQSVLAAYLAGNCVEKTAKLAGVSQSTVSLYLNELEGHLGKAFIRGKCRPVRSVALPTRGKINEKRVQGKNRASVRDFHSFRTTFVTLALMRGLPIDLVRKITGHQTTDVVTKHYFRPEREQLRVAMQKALPGLLTSSAKPFTPAERAAEVLRSVSSKNWRKQVDKALKILEQIDTDSSI